MVCHMEALCLCWFLLLLLLFPVPLLFLFFQFFLGLSKGASPWYLACLQVREGHLPLCVTQIRIFFSLSEWSLCHGDGEAAHNIWKPNVCNQGQCYQSGSASAGETSHRPFFPVPLLLALALSHNECPQGAGLPHLPSRGRRHSSPVLSFTLWLSAVAGLIQGHETWKQSESCSVAQLLRFDNHSGGADLRALSF